jgi:hypothetical protein
MFPLKMAVKLMLRASLVNCIAHGFRLLGKGYGAACAIAGLEAPECNSRGGMCFLRFPDETASDTLRASV